MRRRIKLKAVSGAVVEKWRRKTWKQIPLFAVANEAKRLAIGHIGFRSYVEIMDFEGDVLRKFRTKNMQQIEITSDASKVYLLSGKKILAYNSNGEKLKEYKEGGCQFSILEDGSMVTDARAPKYALMDAEGNKIHFTDGMHWVIDAFSGKLELKQFYPNLVGIAPNGTYVVVYETTGQTRQYFKGTSSVSETVLYGLNNIYIRPQGTKSLLESKEKKGSQQWRCVPFNLKNTGMEPKSLLEYGAAVCVHNLFFAFARKSIGYFGLDGNLKWEFALPQPDEIKQFYVTPDAEYVFFTLKRKKKRKNLYILDTASRKIMVKALENGIANFKVSNDGRQLFVSTFKGELIAFDVRRKLLQQILGG
jgi:hypothetical protein